MHWILQEYYLFIIFDKLLPFFNVPAKLCAVRLRLQGTRQIFDRMQSLARRFIHRGLFNVFTLSSRNI